MMKHGVLTGYLHVDIVVFAGTQTCIEPELIKYPAGIQHCGMHSYIITLQKMQVVVAANVFLYLFQYFTAIIYLNVASRNKCCFRIALQYLNIFFHGINGQPIVGIKKQQIFSFAVVNTGISCGR